MADRNPALSILPFFEAYLNSLPFSNFQKDNIFHSYFDLKNVLLKQPFEPKKLNDFFSAYRLKNHDEILFEENASFSKPQNFIQKAITFLTDIENFPLYDPYLKKQYNFLSPYQKIRSFNVDQNNLSFYRCIGFAHLEYLIKTRNSQKLLNYSKVKLSPSHEFDEYNNVLHMNLLQIINSLQNPALSEDLIADFIKKIDIYPTKFLDSIVLLVKTLLMTTIEDHQALGFFNIFLTASERNQALSSIHSNQNYIIPEIVKRIASCIFNMNLTILNISTNQEPFTEKNTSKLENSQNVNLINFEKTGLYTLAFTDDLLLSRSNSNNLILSRSPTLKKQNTDHLVYSMPMKQDNLEKEKVNVQRDHSQLGLKNFNEFEIPNESFSLTTTPKPRKKEDQENMFEFSIPSERKNTFKIDYEYEELGKKNKLFQEKVKEFFKIL